MDESVWLAAANALLHDIGKFALRAGAGAVEPPRREVSVASAPLHSRLGAWFIQEHTPEAWRKKGHFSPVAAHHSPQTQFEAWVSLADHLASFEPLEAEDRLVPRLRSVFSRRAGEERPEGVENKSSKGRPAKKERLLSYDRPFYLPLGRLDPTCYAATFPVLLPSLRWDEEHHRPEYARLWAEFIQEWEARGLRKMTHQEIFLETAYSLLQEFTWSQPSSGAREGDDVSLFDHARAASAIAACLAVDDRSFEWCQALSTAPAAERHDEPVCCLVGADLSGLQSFLYTLASRGAAKSLRARSFYIQMLGETLAFYLLDSLKLPQTNLLYVGGGGFELLVPMARVSELPGLAARLANRLLVLHQGGLGLSLEWQPVTYAGFKAFQETRQLLGEKLAIAKRRPFAAASPEALLASIGQPYFLGGDPLKFCAVTGEDGENVRQDQDGTYKSNFVLSLEDLGRLLPRATHLLLTPVRAEAPAPASGWQTALRVFGLDVRLVSRGEMPKEKVTSNVTQGFSRVWRLDPQPVPGETELLRPYGLGATVASYRPFARLTPLDAGGAPRTFDDLSTPQLGGFHRLGVLRLDVDNLGLFFKEGLGEQVSLARLAGLSFALRLFFEGWLPQLALPGSTQEAGLADLSRYVYLQYSGGDDLFVVGAWDVLPEFARRVRVSFSDFTASGPLPGQSGPPPAHLALSLSGGLALVEPGFPLYQAARLAGEAEASAKAFRRPNGHTKDAFTFLDTTLDWPAFHESQRQAIKLTAGVRRWRSSQSAGLPRSLLQTLLALHGQLQEARRDGRKLLFGPWTWLAAYQLTRLAAEAKDEADRNTIQDLRDQFLHPNPQTETLGLAARWAQFLTRGD